MATVCTPHTISPAAIVSSSPVRCSHSQSQLLFRSNLPNCRHHSPSLPIISAPNLRAATKGQVLCSQNPNPTPTRRPEYVPNRIPDPNYIRIFDTTLRDGEQSPGASLTSKEKLNIARQLAKLGVDIIEAGFPAASKDDFVAVKMIAKEVGNFVDKDGYVPVICGLSRCIEKDIKTAWEAVKYAKRPRIHTFIATSPIHMEHKLRKTKEQVIEMARSMVSYAKSLGCQDVQFSPEDAGRSEKEFLYQILGEVIKAGATTLNIPDTVGYNVPTEFGQLIADIKSNTPGIDDVIISAHCHNDLGLSTANTLAGASRGARQLEVTINGIGERAGNASLEEVVMTLNCRGEHVFGGLYTGINPRHIYMTSKMVSEYTGMHVQQHKAIVGANAFAHESGIHQDGMLKDKRTYEIISPEDIGYDRSSEAAIVLGKLRFLSQLREMGSSQKSSQWRSVFDGVKLKTIPSMPEALMAEINTAICNLEYARASVLLESTSPSSSSSSISKNESSAQPQFDARKADQAYKAGCAALAAGKLDEALLSLNVSLSKCPPNQTSAVAKLHSLISLTSQ